MENPTPNGMSPHLRLLFCVILLCCWLNSATAKAAAATYNVVKFGAKPDGHTDSTKAFLNAWSKACASPNPVAIYVPQGRFLLRSATFSGKCTNKAISITIDGTLVALSDYRVTGNSGKWLHFKNVDGVSIRGGVLDGQGTALWNCKNSAKSNCPTGATTLGFSNSKNIVVGGLTSINSQMFHIVFNGCQNVKVQGVKIMADGNSPNTDGIHVQMSSHVTILNSKIRTGDDCISIGPGTTNLWIQNIACGPGHGISIGSLGWELNEPGVQNVTVKTVTFTGTQNGVRIKSWGRPSNGFVRNVVFQDAVMVNVQNPIVIDQNYCPDNKGCPGKASGVKISDVTYQDIHGTSATQVAVKFDCSSKYPCSGIRLKDVKLTYKNQAAQASCNHAGGTASGSVQPESCL
ncbi:Pectin lyase fold/virulence factor [Sesbania bispinosa]|nr:Pectin lyase fold/virulence factor [Sesbania bispinosa]